MDGSPPVADARFSDRLDQAASLETDIVGAFFGRRMRASRMVLWTEGVSDVDAAIDHTLVFHIGGGGATRYNEGRKTGHSDRLQRCTMIPGLIPAGWDLPEGADILHLYVDDSDLRRFAHREYDIDPSKVEIRDHMGVEDDFMRGLAPLVLQELSSPLPQSHLMLDSFDAVITNHMLRAYSNTSDTVLVRQEIDAHHRDHAAVQKARDCLLDRLSENITADELAREVGISPFRLMRAFKAEMGITIHRFVMEKRVAFVRDRLRQSDAPLVDIALAAGFANQSHMTSCYTSIMGISPGRHRRQLRG